MLHAAVSDLKSFGAALGIKHLMLEMSSIECSRLSSALSVLKQLQTLWLADPSRPVHQTSGVLSLEALRSLQSVALDGVVPESIELVEGCTVSIEQHSQWSIEHAVWETLLHRLRSVLLSVDVIEALPSILLRAGTLAKATLLGEHFGTAAAPLLLCGSLGTCGRACRALHGLACCRARACRLARC